MFTLTIREDQPGGEPGDPVEVVTTSRDIVAWELGDRRRSVGQLSENLRMADITDLAWYAASRRGLTDLDVRQWRAAVDIDFRKTDEDDDEEGEGGDGDPTPKGR